MNETGFHEKVSDNEVTSFENMAHSLVEFEARLDPADEKPVNTG